MNKNALIVTAVIGIVIAGSFAIMNKKNIDSSTAPTSSLDALDNNNLAPPSTTRIQQNGTTAKNWTVEILAEGFAPPTLNITAEDNVTWINRLDERSWPASDMHPTHTRYPGSDIQKCGTAEAQNIFDACKGLHNGERWSFVFTKTGTWQYHDHLAPGLIGTIVVSN